MTYRPITDVWILGRPKTGYYGSYPAGFLQRARNLLGVGRMDAVLHVCSGAILDYRCGPTCEGRKSGKRHYHGFGPNDKTLDLNPEVKPDYLRDAREPYPRPRSNAWDAILIDRPYTEDDADEYIKHGLQGGRFVLPSPQLLVKNAIDVLPIGGKVGILDYKWPSPPKNGREVALVGVAVGRKSNARWYTVFERTA